MAKLLLLLGVIGLLGCAPSPTSRVRIGLKPQSSCRWIGDVRCTAWSKPELRTGLKAEAAGLGANYVQLDSVVRNGKGYEARGVAFSCR